MQGCSEHVCESLAECVDYAHSGIWLLSLICCRLHWESAAKEDQAVSILSLRMCAELKAYEAATALQLGTLV